MGLLTQGYNAVPSVKRSQLCKSYVCDLFCPRALAGDVDREHLMQYGQYDEMLRIAAKL